LPWGEKVGDGEEGPQDRALGYICSDWTGIGFEGFELYELSVA